MHPKSVSNQFPGLTHPSGSLMSAAAPRLHTSSPIIHPLVWMKNLTFFAVCLAGFLAHGRSIANPEPFSNSIGMQFLRLEAGTFIMGQDGPRTDANMMRHPGEFDHCDWDEGPSHPVTISRPFAMSVTEVTLGDYRAMDPDFRADSPQDPRAALTGVSWHQAVKFCEWLSQKEGKPYRLPTEAEWEYACRAGTDSLFSAGSRLPDGFQKWYGEDNRRSLYFTDSQMPPEYSRVAGRPGLIVAQGLPNPWGLHDMHGNVSEWCLDWYGPYEPGNQTDPAGRTEGEFRVIRGGAHSEFVRMLRSANRRAWLPSSKSSTIGFRIVQGELPAGNTLPLPEVQDGARTVNQHPPTIVPAPADIPIFEGPKPFVRIPPNSIGPLFSWHNHSPAITECPNGDLLAIWYSCVDEAGPELNNAASRLRFGQQEWESASPFWDGPDVNDHAPKLWWDGDRTLYHLARGLTENIVRRSYDSGATWTTAQPVFPCNEFGNGMIRTREGVLVISQDSRQASLLISRDGGHTWCTVGKDSKSDFRPGGHGVRHAGIHAPVVQLADGRLMTIGRYDKPEDQERFGFRTPISYTADLGETWTYAASEFPAISSVQRPVLFRLREGPILLCSFTDQSRDWKVRKGMTFRAVDGSQFTGFGLFAALSLDEGQTWPYRRLITPNDGQLRELPIIDRSTGTFSDTMAERNGYLAVTQTRDGRIQLISSKNHYVFNLAWLKQLPPVPRTGT